MNDIAILKFMAITLFFSIIFVAIVNFIKFTTTPNDFIRFRCKYCNKNVTTVKIKEDSIHCSKCGTKVAELVSTAAIKFESNKIIPRK